VPASSDDGTPGARHEHYDYGGHQSSVQMQNRSSNCGVQSDSESELESEFILSSKSELAHCNVTVVQQLTPCYVAQSYNGTDSADPD